VVPGQTPNPLPWQGRDCSFRACGRIIVAVTPRMTVDKAS
jgi:hypothetical protein